MTKSLPLKVYSGLSKVYSPVPLSMSSDGLTALQAWLSGMKYMSYPKTSPPTLPVSFRTTSF